MNHLVPCRIHQEKQITSSRNTKQPPSPALKKKKFKKSEDKKDTNTTDSITLTVFLCPSCLVLLFNSFPSCYVPEIKRYKILFQTCCLITIFGLLCKLKVLLGIAEYSLGIKYFRFQFMPEHFPYSREKNLLPDATKPSNLTVPSSLKPLGLQLNT